MLNVTKGPSSLQNYLKFGLWVFFSPKRVQRVVPPRSGEEPSFGGISSSILPEGPEGCKRAVTPRQGEAHVMLD